LCTLRARLAGGCDALALNPRDDDADTVGGGPADVDLRVTHAVDERQKGGQLALRTLAFHLLRPGPAPIRHGRPRLDVLLPAGKVRFQLPPRRVARARDPPAQG